MQNEQENNVFTREPWHLNVSELSLWMGVHRDTLHGRGLTSQPDAEIGRERLFDVRRVMREDWAVGVGLDDNGELIDYEAERKKKIRAERIGQEIKNAEALGELAPIDLMRSVLRDCLQTANGWLETVPASIKRVWPEVPGSVLDAVERECSKVRNSIADGRINYSDNRMAEYSRKPSMAED